MTEKIELLKLTVELTKIAIESKTLVKPAKETTLIEYAFKLSSKIVNDSYYQTALPQTDDSQAVDE